MVPREILANVRDTIREYAGSDADKWFYANRFIFVRFSGIGANNMLRRICNVECGGRE